MSGLKMGDSDQARADGEIERLREAVDAEARRCAELQRQLERANAEFEEFVSLAAHNLRERLRDVASYSQLMAETYSDRLDPDAGAFLGRIQKGAAGMQSLLADVVDYWTTSSCDPPSSPTDMEAVLRQALVSTEKQIAERSAIVTHDPLPPVIGDFEALAKVLRHLIRNAVEYSGAPSPRVHVAARRDDLELVFSVQDNGPGIDPAFHSRLFRVFKPLHGKDHAGNGLGLAFCRKAVERHGGRMWVESALGAGSTFYFTLPPAD